jgi:hypothetical protein
MAISVKESIAATLVCASISHRNQVKSVLDNYADRPRVGLSRAPDYLEENLNKYGDGPTLLVLFEFGARSDADEAWADAMAVWPGNFQDGSHAAQYQSVEGDGINDHTFWHVQNVPPQPGDF